MKKIKTSLKEINAQIAAIEKRTGVSIENTPEGDKDYSESIKLSVLRQRITSL